MMLTKLSALERYFDFTTFIIENIYSETYVNRRKKHSEFRRNQVLPGIM